MEDWQKELTEWMENVAVSVEGMVNEVVQSADNAAEQFQDDLVREIDQFLDDIFTPIIDISFEEEFHTYYYSQESDLMLSPKIEPTHNIHPACQGCIHYHGRLYGKNLFVCAMHPYGSTMSSCPDWEGKSIRM